jgi:hypothetical protein
MPIWKRKPARCIPQRRCGAVSQRRDAIGIDKKLSTVDLSEVGFKRIK